MKLMIVESPTKVKKIKSFLGSEWIVAASIGHIRDLPEGEMGFKPPDFIPKYVIYPDKKKTLKRLKELAAKAKDIYLATDPDREGEAIAFHLKEALRLQHPKRISFNEITKSAVLKAIAIPRQIDSNLQKAQEARRVLDRIVGYEVSPVLTSKAGKPLSAGRVQSPAVKLIALREKQIRQFKGQYFYSVDIEIENGIRASLLPKDWSDDGKHIFSKELAQSICAASSKVLVEDVKIEDKATKPRAPFITSTLQQAASRLFKFSPADTMKVAQALFEQGAISYHRTDSPNLSQESFELIANYAASNGHSVQDKQIVYARKKGAQEAHEAIRPTNIEKEDSGSDEQEKKLYSLIRERALASVLIPAVDCITTFIFTSTEKVTAEDKSSFARFCATGKVEKKRGWRFLCTVEKVEPLDAKLPAMVSKGESFDALAKIVEKKTEPPSRLSEANLVKALERLGIGRPSTYASILENIKARKYIEIRKLNKEHKIVPTTIGEKLMEALDSMSFMNLDYTRILEESLDKVAVGKMSYTELIAHVYQEIKEQLRHIKMTPLVDTRPCPNCKKPIRRLKSKKSGGGYFWIHLEEQESCKKFISDTEAKEIGT